jgi:hypothetical protein
MFDHAAKGVAVFNDNRGQCLDGDVSHVAGAFVETAKFAAIPDGAAHLPCDLCHDVVVHGAHGCNTGLHQCDPFSQGARGPFGLRRLGARDGGVRMSP